MSDQSPPPKPKPGSLRDRIAAFEKSSASQASAPSAPPPRPKPVGLSWKPKAPSPPSSPKSTADNEKKPAGMSVSDAKESIGKGGSLKERMAALQGRGGFGAPSPPVAPKPAVERPKWKPPPAVSPPTVEEPVASEAAATSDADVPESKETLPTTQSTHATTPPATEEVPQQQEEADDQNKETVDPEEEERQRRAAIAARMARLGGARVGMGPPIFGKPSIPAKKPSLPPQEDTLSDKDKGSKNEDTPTTHSVIDEPTPETGTSATGLATSAETDAGAPSSESTPERTINEPLLQPPSGPSPPPSHLPTSMPVPAGPRRAAPPRRKAAKSPAPPLEESAAPAVPPNEETTTSTSPSEESESVAALVPSSEESAHTSVPVSEELTFTPVPGSDVPTSIVAPVTEELVSAPHAQALTKDEEPEYKEISADSKGDQESPLQSSRDVPAQVPQATSSVDDESPVTTKVPESGEEREDVQLVTHEHTVDATEVRSPPPPQHSPSVSHAASGPHDPPIEEAAEEEEDDDARRQRVAARLAKMGAINPFAPPPIRRDSHDVVSPTTTGSPSVQPPSGNPDKTSHEDSSASPTVEERSPAAKEHLKGTLASPTQAKDIVHSGSTTARDDRINDPIKSEDEEDDVTTNVSGGREENSDHTQSVHIEVDSYQSVPDPSVDEPLDPLENEEEVSNDPDAGSLADLPVISDVASQPKQPPPLSNIRETDPPPPHRRSVPPPRRVLPQSPDRYDNDEADTTPPAATETVPPSSQILGHPHRAVPQPPEVVLPVPPARLPPRPIQDEESQDEEDFLPHSHTAHDMSHETPSRSGSLSSDIASDIAMHDVSKPRPIRSVPPLRSSQVQLASDEPQTPSQASQPDDEALPTVPRFQTASQGSNDEAYLDVPSSPEEVPEGEDEAEVISPVPPPRPFRTTKASVETPSPPLAVSVPSHEILDESEGDPIDPTFHSPISPKSSNINLRADISPSGSAPEADEEQLRRQTIAERMAKLGGIRLGPAPPLMRRPPPTPTETSDATDEVTPDNAGEPDEEEEDEQARRQRILARLAGSGGVRLGVLPQSLVNTADKVADLPSPPPPPPHRVAHPARSPPVEISPETPSPPSPPPHRAVHRVRSPPTPNETDSEHDSQAFSDDGVRVEAEESELEEVSHEDAEVPPPIPVRIGRHPSTDSTSTAREQTIRKPSLPPAIPAGRPPIPKVNVTSRKTSADSGSHLPQETTFPPQTDYVMVEESAYESEEVPPPPPPRRMSRPPPSRDGPPPPPKATEDTDLSSSQWEIPSVPTASIDFGSEEPDLSLSNWSEDSTAFVSSIPAAAPSPHTATSADLEDRPRSSEELMMVWGRVGVQICEVATTLFEKSKKSLIGDGTYPGFIHAVLAEVPNAASPRAPFVYGSLIYMQTANAVQKRLADIMPGDIVLLDDVKLKGHKGLQTYHQNVGTDEPLVAVISDFEAKKSKIRVFQANQHVGQQTVESVSYRLEDVKSGIVKIFRVLEA